MTPYWAQGFEENVEIAEAGRAMALRRAGIFLGLTVLASIVVVIVVAQPTARSSRRRGSK